ncbi:hypothetical protein O988_08906 [Pseudogymnoascus sp. VKM F-3808]|nr:hypothetical protein O988_08906 [Pseudogymnoascus sp. VKM F-3808]
MEMGAKTPYTLYDIEERETDTRLLSLLTSISRADDPATDTDLYDDADPWDETAIYADPWGFDEAAGVMAELGAEEEEDEDKWRDEIVAMDETG